MAFEKMIRDMIRHEVEHAIAPLAAVIAELQERGDLTAQLGSLLGVKRGPGRPRKLAVVGRKPAPLAKKSPCAVVGCKRSSRSKGYCAAHYQKRRMLERTKRLPGDWTENAKPHTVKDIVLPRGRAGAKALAAAKAK